MITIDADRMIQTARRCARIALTEASPIRLFITPIPHDRFAAFSPDADWLMITADTEEAAKVKAMSALVSVGVWCGTDSRRTRPD